MDSLFDLWPPSRPLIPRFTPLRDTAEGRREYAAREAERKRRIAEATATARMEWQATRTALACNTVAVVVLGIHQPEPGDDGAACAECVVPDGYESTMQAPWPCDTYSAVRRERP